MRVRKVAKQLKRRHYSYVRWDKEKDEPIYTYHMSDEHSKIAYIVRMTKKHYFGLAKKYSPNSMMGKLYIHKACSTYLFDDIMEFWGVDVND